jgi:hypothetical protein
VSFCFNAAETFRVVSVAFSVVVVVVLLTCVVVTSFAGLTSASDRLVALMPPAEVTV